MAFWRLVWEALSKVIGITCASSSTTDKRTPPKASFFTLSIELRNKIYELILPRNLTYKPVLPRKKTFLEKLYRRLVEDDDPPNAPPALCIASQQLRNETLPIWRGNNNFHFMGPADDVASLKSWLNLLRQTGLRFIRNMKITLVETNTHPVTYPVEIWTHSLDEIQLGITIRIHSVIRLQGSRYEIDVTRNSHDHNSPFKNMSFPPEQDTELDLVSENEQVIWAVKMRYWVALLQSYRGEELTQSRVPRIYTSKGWKYLRA